MEMLKTAQIIVVLGPQHRERMADDAVFGRKCVGGELVGERLCLRKFSVGHGIPN